MFIGVSLFVVYLPYWLEEDLGVTPERDRDSCSWWVASPTC